MLVLQNRNDLMNVFNRCHFIFRHYARGYYPVSRRKLTPMPVNRMFFPLENSNGGENFIEDSFRKYPLIPGNMYFVPAFLPARFWLDNQLLFLSIHTNLEIFPGVELFSDCPRMLEIPLEKERDELLQYFDSCRQELYPNSLKAGLKVFSILAGILDYYQPENFWKPLALRQYCYLMDYLKTHGDAQTSVQDLAGLEHESRENFTRKFTARTGITPKQLINRFVMSRCLSLIHQGYLFKEISEILHFRDEFAFSVYFKRNMGESPRAWRNWQTSKLPAKVSAETDSGE